MDNGGLLKLLWLGILRVQGVPIIEVQNSR
jgi:hypothetical protein